MNDVVRKIVMPPEREKTIVENSEYIDWLEAFTTKRSGFSSESWLYNKESISRDDLAKVTDLGIFFKAIYNHAKKNYIPIEICNGECITLKHNNIYFQIGYSVGKGTLFYVARCKPMDHYLDFDLVLNDSMNDRTVRIINELNELEMHISKMIEEDVPIYAIEEHTASVLKLSKKNK